MNKNKFSIEQRCEKCGTTFQSKMGPEWLLKKYGQILCRKCGHHANMIKKYGSEEEYQKAKDRIYSGIRKRNGLHSLNSLKSVLKMALKRFKINE